MGEGKIIKAQDKINNWYIETAKYNMIDVEEVTESQVIKYLAIQQVKKLNIDDVSNCLHENQVMRQGDGDVYHQCLDCCELLE